MTSAPRPPFLHRIPARAWARQQEQLTAFDCHGATADGHEVPLAANVGGAVDAVATAAAGAQGVALLRTEFRLLGQAAEPTVAEQIEKYRGVFAAFPGRKVVMRALDARAAALAARPKLSLKCRVEVTRGSGAYRCFRP